MKAKINTQNFKIDMFKGCLVLVLLLFSFSDLFSQVTVTDVFPTRVTTGSKVTVIGTGFSSIAVDKVLLGVVNNSIPIKDQVYVSETELTFVIDRTGISRTRSLTIGGVPYPYSIAYIQPKSIDYDNDPEIRVTEVFTSWDKDNTSFWRSGILGTGGKPNNRHDLLAFTYRGITYSTGVDDTILTNNSISYTSQTFKAYSTNGVTGKAHDQNYLAMADLIDGKVDQVVNNSLVRATVYDVLLDGRNGLDMGSGITNLNRSAHVEFFSGNGNVGALNNIPDLLITQIADPGKADIYYYADINGDIVGTPILLKIPKSTHKLFDWRVDLYNMTQGVSYDISYPTGAGFTAKQERAFRMAAFELGDFDIKDNSSTPELHIGNISTIVMMAGGEADLAFMAYNKAAFAIKSPQIDEFPISRNLCELPNTIGVTFSADGSVENPTGDTREVITYQWYKDYAPIPGATSKTYTLPSPIIEQDLLTYKVRVKNGFGAIDLSAKLSKGGIPAYWNGPMEGWVYPSNYYNGPIHTTSNLKFPIDNADRNLIFAQNYSENVDLEGCDCIIVAGKNVTIPEGKTLTLYNTITVEDPIPATAEPGSIAIPAGTFTLMDNASLVQMKPLPIGVNQNFGEITVNRIAKSLKKYDYVYWSSPVENGNVSMIPGATQHVYWWDVNLKAANQTINTAGNWNNTIPGGIMENGRGYIKRVNGEVTIPSVFDGKPNNGRIEVLVSKTLGEVVMNSLDKHNNLIGNPYPSAINAETFLLENTMLEGFVKIWAHDTELLNSSAGEPFYGGGFKYNFGDQYFTYNKVGTVPPAAKPFEGKIASGQGFIVKVLESAPNESFVNFQNKMRYTVGQDAYDNSDFYRSVSSNVESNNEKQLIWLSLVNDKNMSSVTLVGYAEGATNGNDRLYDANSGSGAMRIYSVLEDSDLIIQGRALPFEDSDKVSLGVEILKNGIYKIGIDKLKGSLMLNEDQGIYLEDTYNNVIHNLRNTPYSFTATTGDVKDRFVLRYTNKTLSVDDSKMSETFVYVKNEQLYVKASKNIESIVVYDLTGKKLMDYKLDGYADKFNAPFQFPKGAYLTVIKLENSGSITKKVMN